jgi:hypothetical protein
MHCLSVGAGLDGLHRGGVQCGFWEGSHGKVVCDVPHLVAILAMAASGGGQAVFSDPASKGGKLFDCKSGALVDAIVISGGL